MRGDPVYNETRMEIKDKERKRKQRRKMSFMFNYKGSCTYYVITDRGGSSQMITVLREGGVASDYDIP